MAQGRYPRLSAPLRICGQEIKNRVVVPAMSDFGTVAPDGLVQQSHVDRYEAYGAAGQDLSSPKPVPWYACTKTGIPLSLRTMPALRACGACPAPSTSMAVALAQIMLTGLATMPEDSIAAISREDFLRYKKAFVDAALRCQKAGFDGVELHAAHGMYLGEVSETSTREDGYGGELLGRLRLVTELLQEIRALCGRDFVLAVRFGNADLEELVQMAVAFEKAGADLLDVSFGMRQYQPCRFWSRQQGLCRLPGQGKDAAARHLCEQHIHWRGSGEHSGKGPCGHGCQGADIWQTLHGLAKRLLEKNRLRAGAAQCANGSGTASSVRQGRRFLLFPDKIIEGRWLQRALC